MQVDELSVGQSWPVGLPQQLVQVDELIVHDGVELPDDDELVVDEGLELGELLSDDVAALTWSSFPAEEGEGTEATAPAAITESVPCVVATRRRRALCLGSGIPDAVCNAQRLRERVVEIRRGNMPPDPHPGSVARRRATLLGGTAEGTVDAIRDPLVQCRGGGHSS